MVKIIWVQFLAGVSYRFKMKPKPSFLCNPNPNPNFKLYSDTKLIKCAIHHQSVGKLF